MSDSSRTSRLIPYQDGLPRPFPGGPEGSTQGKLQEKDGMDPLEEAYRKGIQEGKQQGQEETLRQVEADLAQSREQLQEALKRIASLETTVLREYESALLDIALTAASKIVRERIDRSDPVAVRAMQEAIASLPERTRFTVRLNGRDLPDAAKAFQAEIAEDRIELVEDNSISRGGCMLETPAGNIDATLETAESAVRESAGGEADDS